MSEKKLWASRYIENFNPPYLIEELAHKVCESVADAFLGQVEYGKDYIVRTEMVKEDWAKGLGTKYTHTLTFDELVRCRDCKYYESVPEDSGDWCGYWTDRVYGADGYCKWGERRGE